MNEQMTKYHCPTCKTYLLRAELKTAEIRCRKCHALILFHGKTANILEPSKKVRRSGGIL